MKISDTMLPLPLLWMMLMVSPLSAAATGLVYIDQLPDGDGWRLLDSRSVERCEQRSIQGARCLSVDQLLGQRDRLPSLRDITWLLGSLGLSGEETVVIAGRPGLERDFIAGVIYLAGQRRVLVLRTPLSQSISSKNWPVGPGQRRSMSRETQYVATPRDRQIVLRHELWRLIQAQSPRVLDARSDAEYWGVRIRGYRGGHIPGAEHLDITDLQSTRMTANGIQTVIYGHAPLDSIASFTRLQSQWEESVYLLIDGWRVWAADSTLPVDSESFNDDQKLRVGYQ
ncbi:rhodanese-like domain-containing protein [Sedimenticola hydrogenitrophicus]|uniref:rhodanese-like domain-containing protein n=1 Tax=Sedimenticola hydrogenitrophicus TaxID=2967975 RepID=UPI0023B08D46|nr:rhodanese-like domain-containing protein [Sedimenticola hydrogenitrophicus]